MEEDIKILEELIEDGKEDFTDTRLSDYEIKAIENLIARYKELEEEKELRIRYERRYNLAIENREKNFIRKSKVKWKPIKEYDRQKYDWVLVKYFDGDYECVPEVAEQRIDGKWYTTEREIPFEVKYFFDMQELLED